MLMWMNKLTRNYLVSYSYVPWNLHEPERGKFDFSGNLDLEYVVLVLLFRLWEWTLLRVDEGCSGCHVSLL